MPRTKKIGYSQRGEKYEKTGRYSRGKTYPVKILSNIGIAFSMIIILLACVQAGTTRFSSTKAIEPVAMPTLMNTPAPTPFPNSEDERVTKLRNFISKQKSQVLLPYVEYIIKQSDENGIGWTDIVAIANKESQLCLHIRAESHNCWGWGGSNRIYFKSYEEGIAFTAKTLNENYRANANRGIQLKYCPPSDGCADNWVSTVTATSHEILKTK